MRILLLSLSLLLSLGLVAACVPVNEATPASVQTQPASGTEAATNSIPAVEEDTHFTIPADQLLITQLNNFDYFSPYFQQQITLTDGKLAQTYAGGMMSVLLLPQIAIGDLNGDLLDDAAVLLAENAGGTGVFISMVVLLNREGELEQVADVLIDDRAIIHDLSIRDGVVILDATIHDINDALIEPTLLTRQNYRIFGDHLALTRLSSARAGLSERNIRIKSPVNGDIVTKTIEVKGDMPIAPFENNLRVALYDISGNLLWESGFMVTAADMGAPATFDNRLELPLLRGGTFIRLELAELSMADGSVIALDSVFLMIE